MNDIHGYEQQAVWRGLCEGVTSPPCNLSAARPNLSSLLPRSPTPTSPLRSCTTKRHGEREGLEGRAGGLGADVDASV